MIYELITIGILLLSSVCDLGRKRIPNRVTYICQGVGLVIHGLSGGPPGIIFSLKGMAIMFILLYPVYIVRGLGAGDVKLFMAVASFLGACKSITILIISMPISVIFGLIKKLMIYKGRRGTVGEKTYIEYAPIMLAAYLLMLGHTYLGP